MAKPSPEIVDFVKALAKANAARDIARLKQEGRNSNDNAGKAHKAINQ